jgi:thiosulfate/3-mercaptopyruvate sulfurtransferase
MYEQVVVSGAWLASRLDDPDVRVVDVRDEWEFDGIGHVPGAVNVPFERFRSAGDDDSGMLPGADVWADLLGEAGIEPDDTVVAYDDTHGVFAARFLVTAELYGHTDFHLLDGDYSAWNRDHETTTDPTPVDPTTYEVSDPTNSPLVDYETVLDVVESDDSDTVVVDTREAWEFDEGHLPGAVHVDWRDAVDEETRGLKPREELLETFAEAGVTPDKRVVLYCNTARRISHTYLVLRHLGFGDVAFYEGSLTEWDDRGGPVE